MSADRRRVVPLSGQIGSVLRSCPRWAVAPVALLFVSSVLMLTGCSPRLPGHWEHSCEPSTLVPDRDRCHASLKLEDTALAFVREADGWLLAAAWESPDFRMLQATIDIPGLRKSVRAENGFCSADVCWIELTRDEAAKLSTRRHFRVELTRVFLREAGGMRRGTTGFSATTAGLAQALERIE
jgi:hypothetical protein